MWLARSTSRALACELFNYESESEMEVFLNDVRLSFADLRKRGLPPKDKPTEPGKFGCHGIFEKESQAHQRLREAIVAVAKEAWKDNWQNVIGAMEKDKKCLREGDKNLDKNGKQRDEYKGKMYVKASNPNPVPLVAAIAKNPDGSWNILPESSGKPYGGCYVNLKLDVYASTKHGNAVHASLLAVQFVRDGDAFGGAPATADGFENVPGAVEEQASRASMETPNTSGANVGGAVSDLGL